MTLYTCVDLANSTAADASACDRDRDRDRDRDGDGDTDRDRGRADNQEGGREGRRNFVVFGQCTFVCLLHVCMHARMFVCARLSVFTL